jgi:XisI protein
MYAGWNGPYRIPGSVLHLDIRNGKVWIQHDDTEDGIADKLVSARISTDRIVPAFKSPGICPHAGYASA